MTSKIFGFLLLQWVFCSSIMTVYGQRPREIQVDNDPPNMTDIPTLIVIIGIPIILVLGYVFLRQQKTR